eukprot:TRINITY_DN56891_c0_g1_i1.p1 TRINITY_DN56891_c0_g1~~TRINITY_DN56891_c0_g1_i1.p1  ORF type:complete len:150 (+),score=11.92 TRINITY_DN56891_c0_g1_i1:52-501(+)
MRRLVTTARPSSSKRCRRALGVCAGLVAPLVAQCCLSTRTMASQRPIPSLTGFVYLVTGSTDGIGRHTVQKLADTGATVLVHGRKKEKVDAVVEELKKRGAAGAEGFVADLSLMSEVKALGERIAEKYPVIDVLPDFCRTHVLNLRTRV